MQCVGFLNERTLAEEAQRYGDAGNHPQVVWANGVLASTGMGLGVDLVTGWSGRRATVEYLSFDGNTGTVTPHVRLVHLQENSCDHHSQEGAGDPS
jgi:molybdopterin-synthase adenylyltransferase